jgi:hypothetical protein
MKTTRYGEKNKHRANERSVLGRVREENFEEAINSLCSWGQLLVPRVDYALDFPFKSSV